MMDTELFMTMTEFVNYCVCPRSNIPIIVESSHIHFFMIYLCNGKWQFKNAGISTGWLMYHKCKALNFFIENDFGI